MSLKYSFTPSFQSLNLTSLLPALETSGFTNLLHLGLLAFVGNSSEEQGTSDIPLLPPWLQSSLAGERGVGGICLNISCANSNQVIQFSSVWSQKCNIFHL